MPEFAPVTRARPLGRGAPRSATQCRSICRSAPDSGRRAQAPRRRCRTACKWNARRGEGRERDELRDRCGPEPAPADLEAQRPAGQYDHYDHRHGSAKQVRHWRVEPECQASTGGGRKRTAPIAAARILPANERIGMMLACPPSPRWSSSGTNLLAVVVSVAPGRSPATLASTWPASSGHTGRRRNAAPRTGRRTSAATRGSAPAMPFQRALARRARRWLLSGLTGAVPAGLRTDQELSEEGDQRARWPRDCSARGPGEVPPCPCPGAARRRPRGDDRASPVVGAAREQAGATSSTMVALAPTGEAIVGSPHPMYWISLKPHFPRDQGSSARGMTPTSKRRMSSTSVASDQGRFSTSSPSGCHGVPPTLITRIRRIAAAARSAGSSDRR